MKDKRIVFFIFAISFFLFAFFAAQYWGPKMIQQDNSITEGVGNYRQAIFLLVVVSSFILLSTVNSKNVRGIHLLCILWIILMPLFMFLNHSKAMGSYTLTILWPLVFETGYCLTYYMGIPIRKFRNLFFPILFIGLYYFVQSRIHMGRLEQTNTIYFSFLTLPFLLCTSNKRWQFAYLIMLSILALLSYKRSIFFVLIIIWLSYIILIMKNGRNRVLAIVISVILAFGSIIAFSRVNEISGGVLSNRIFNSEYGEGEARTYIWAVTWNMIEQSSIDGFVVGHGHMGVYNNHPLEISAHNDFLEVMYDYGLIIFVLYLLLWLYVFFRVINFVKKKSVFTYPYIVSFAIFLVMSMVSHLILYSTYFNYLVLFWGCVEGVLQREKLVNPRLYFHEKLK